MALADATADRGDALHRRMVVGGEQEADADIAQARLGIEPGAFHVETEHLERIRGARFRGCGAIAVLGDRHAARRDDDRDRSRNIQRMVAIATGAADIDRAMRRVDRDEPGAECLCGLGNLDAGLAAVAERDQEFGDRLFRGFRVENVGECLRRALARLSGADVDPG